MINVTSIETLAGRELWYITDIWETLCAVPVRVISVSKDGELTVVWKVTEEYSEEYEGISMIKLYYTREDAEWVISQFESWHKMISESFNRYICDYLEGSGSNDVDTREFI